MQKKLLGALAAAASTAGLLLPAAPASGATQGTTDDLAYGHIRSTAFPYDQCLVVLSNGSNGNNPTVYDCLNFDDQMWYYPKVGTIGPIINKNTLLYLTAQGQTPGSPAFMYYNSGYPDQQWSAEQIPGAGPVVRFRNINSGLCLVVQTYAGARAMQYDCLNYADQQWKTW
ncbi:RICIN domain-containing protein [Kitasatospora sp. NPDC001660]